MVTPGTYLSGSIFVKSGTVLEVQKGATIVGSRKLEDYPIMPTRISGIEMSWPAALVNIYGSTMRASPARAPSMATARCGGSATGRCGTRRAQRAALGVGLRRQTPAPDSNLQLHNVTVSGLPAYPLRLWTVHICYSDHVHVDGVTIRNNEGGRGPSTDGIDIDSSKHVL